MKEANRKIAAMKKAAKSQSKFNGEVEIIDSEEDGTVERRDKEKMVAPRTQGNPWYDGDGDSSVSDLLPSSPDSQTRPAGKTTVTANTLNRKYTFTVNNNNDVDEMTVKILAKRYEELYRIAQDTTLESMEPMEIHDPESEKMDDLKTKLLFSIIVLAFRVTFRHRVELWTRVRVMLQLPVLPSTNDDGNEKQMNPPCAAVENSLTDYLQRTVDHFDLSVCVQEVCDQVWETLYDFPSLKKSASLINFVEDSVRIAWALVTVTPASLVEFGSARFDPTRHALHGSANLSSTEIKRFLWPTLVDANTGAVRSKGVVVT